VTEPPNTDALPVNEENVENVENIAVPETSGDGTRRGRGRPRTRETIARDDAVLHALRENGPMSRERLAELLNEPTSLIYLALWRLSHQDPPAVQKIGDGGLRHAWQVL
jgi:hypothetical protein